MQRSAKVTITACLMASIGLGCAWRRPKEAMRAYAVRDGEGAFREIAARFEDETGVRVGLKFARRRALYEIVERSRDGDLVIASERGTLEQLRKDGLSGWPSVPVGELVPVIVVAKGNPKRIWTLADLARPTVKVALAAEGDRMGEVIRAILRKNGLTRMVERNVVARPRGPKKTAASVDGKKVDATIIWLWTLRKLGSDRVEAVAIAPGQNVVEPIEAMVLNTGKNAAAAARFLDYLRTPTARAILAREGLLTLP